jgi:hypothetical protein
MIISRFPLVFAVLLSAPLTVAATAVTTSAIKEKNND